MGEHGIKETKEVLIGANELSLVMMKLLKDGFQPGQDIMALFMQWQTNDELRAALQAAAENIAAVPAEVKEVDYIEGFELVKVQIEYVPRLLEAMKKEV